MIENASILVKVFNIYFKSGPDVESERIVGSVLNETNVHNNFLHPQPSHSRFLGKSQLKIYIYFVGIIKNNKLNWTKTKFY